MELPPVPEGFFWRVHTEVGFMMVTLRRKKGWGSRSVESSVVLENPPVPSAIHAAAERALKKFDEREAKARFLSEFRTYEGDYK